MFYFGGGIPYTYVELCNLMDKVKVIYEYRRKDGRHEVKKQNSGIYHIGM